MESTKNLIIFGILLAFNSLSAQYESKDTTSKAESNSIGKGFATQGTTVIYGGVNGGPTGVAGGINYFLANKFNLGVEFGTGHNNWLNYVSNGAPWPNTVYRSYHYSRQFYQIGGKAEYHFRKHKIFDPYINLGLHYYKYTTEMKDQGDALDDFAPMSVSLNIGFRVWLSRNISCHLESGYGNGTAKFGLAIKL